MIASPDDLGPWRPSEDARYEPCPVHRAATDRMEFDDAWDFAAHHCEECVAAVRPDPDLAADRCPYCAGNRTADDAGPGWVDFACEDCGRVGREAVDEP